MKLRQLCLTAVAPHGTLLCAVLFPSSRFSLDGGRSGTNEESTTWHHLSRGDFPATPTTAICRGLAYGLRGLPT
jgi:hypothetical protein